MRTRLLSLALLAALGPVASGQAVTMDWVTVGDPGNACETQVDTWGGGCFGSVASAYRIGKYETTNAQYVEFLNAKAASDPLSLYSTSMAGFRGGITRSGSPGSYTYNTVAGRENKPVNYVSFYDALRFINWLNNGQGSGDTETGAYTLLGGTATPSNGLTVTRNAGASIFLTSEDEWYKAAYYDAISTSYNPYPFADGFNGAVCESPAGTTTHSANCNFAVGGGLTFPITDVGAYTTSPSAYGTFDQGGNVWEWNEAIVIAARRGLRNGGFADASASLRASNRNHDFPADEPEWIGFRVASIPEPNTSLLVVAGVLGLAGWRRRCG